MLQLSANGGSDYLYNYKSSKLYKYFFPMYIAI